MEGKWRFCLGLLLSLLHFSHEASSPSSDHYIGAVVEYRPTVKLGDAKETLNANLKEYVKLIHKASKRDVDIVVFPEDGLTSYFLPNKTEMDAWATEIPPPEEEYIPCLGHREHVSHILKELSCAARRNRIYVTVDIAEKVTCRKDVKDDDCPFNGTRYHNTNIALDRSGKIIARYRKVNLFMEFRHYDVTNTPDFVTFDTDFGVRFGTFICFDIFFATPSLNLTAEGVKNFVYPVAWGSEVPFLTAVQMQHGWAYTENVNLLAAGYHAPEGGSMGSGIYSGRNGPLQLTFTDLPDRRMLISRVPKVPLESSDNANRANEESDPEILEIENMLEERNSQQDSCNIAEQIAHPYNTHNRWQYIQNMNHQVDDISQFTTVPVQGSLKETVCHNCFCCHFDIETSSMDPLPHYRAAVFKGCRMFGLQAEDCISVCGLVQCTNSSTESCGLVTKSDTNFTKLRIKTAVKDYSNSNAIPTMMNSTMIPFSVDEWTFTKKERNDHTHLTIALTKPRSDVGAFGIYIRNFKYDQWLPVN